MSYFHSKLIDIHVGKSIISLTIYTNVDKVN